jgi:hypothetical protein
VPSAEPHDARNLREARSIIATIGRLSAMAPVKPQKLVSGWRPERATVAALR